MGRLPTTRPLVRKGSSLRRNARVIETFLRADRIVQQSMLDSATKSFIQTWVDLVTDILKGKVTITQSQYERLRYFDKDIRKFQSSKTPLYVKKRLLKNQKGGFLGLLASIAAPLISSLLGGILPKK